MHILVLLGSPRVDGNSRRLARAFAEGAEASGHTVVAVDVTKLSIAGCLACGFCGREGSVGVCVQDDDMRVVYEAWDKADAIVWATPLYFYGFSAQLKLVVDRTCAIPGKKNGDGAPRKMGLLVTCQAVSLLPSEGLLHMYRYTCKALGFIDGGHVIATGVHKRGEVEDHPGIAKAYDMGRYFGDDGTTCE